jgi:hypothetical protein
MGWDSTGLQRRRRSAPIFQRSSRSRVTAGRDPAMYLSSPETLTADLRGESLATDALFGERRACPSI